MKEKSRHNLADIKKIQKKVKKGKLPQGDKYRTTTAILHSRNEGGRLTLKKVFISSEKQRARYVTNWQKRIYIASDFSFPDIFPENDTVMMLCQLANIVCKPEKSKGENTQFKFKFY